ncbi:hypothetical protein BKA63DRAFT_88160 [Paraphoma chrysanthemicola]|nr:hypothetical protein BKA63DRAFT_88160 [Paraphoma chrysanthemicola]
MPSVMREWPPWPEFTSPDSLDGKASLLSMKKAIIAEYGADTLRQSWIKVCNELQAITDEIVEKGNGIIPIFDTAHVLADGFTESDQAEIKRIGAFICRSTIPEDETNALYDDMSRYVSDNNASIQAWPKESPSMLILYSSPTQNTIRSHPSQLGLQLKLNELWHGYDASEGTSPEPLAYFDGLRDRAPGQPFLGLGPHIDAGSLSRWADPAYRKVYDSVFRGKPENHDSFDISLRKNADPALYKATAHSSVLRTFQGWTALTPTQPREGTIMVYPNLNSVIAYVLLRPFFQPPKDKDADVMDPHAWTLSEEDSWFPGTFKSQSQRLSRASHPHLRLEECLVHMPKVTAGDTVWWHCDVCHAVDTEHLGKQNAAVAFIGSCPTTPVNSDYIKRQLEATLAGRPPPDYATGDDTDADETKMKGFVGLDGLNSAARGAFGFHKPE